MTDAERVLRKIRSKAMLSSYERAADKKDYTLFYKHVAAIRKTRIFPHFHNSVELAFMLKGSCLVTVNTEKRLLHEGEIAFVNSLEMHQYSPDNDAEYYIMVIGSELFDGENKLSQIAFPSFMERNCGFEKIKAFLDYGISMWSEANTLFKRGFVNCLIGLMFSVYPTKEKAHDRQSEILVKALSYINESFTEDISLEGLALRLGYSPNYFSALFNKFIGVNFREYLNWCRIVEFMRLKKADPKLSASKAAELSGFTSPNTFYRAYKKYKNQL